MKLDKRLVDNVIVLTWQYHETSDVDYIPELIGAKQVLEKNTTWQVVKLLTDLSEYTHSSGKGTREDIYNALAAFGIIVEDKEKKKWQQKKCLKR